MSGLSGLYYILRGKEAVSVTSNSEWAIWFENADRTVKQEYVAGACVSTVFLSINHQHRYHEPPLLFETMVFGGPLDGEQERCTTWDQAESQHADMVERVRRGIQ